MKKWMAMGLLLALLSVPIRAEEPGVYCFSAGEFGEELRGIFLKTVPESGVLRLGDRVLSPGTAVPEADLSRLTYDSPEGLPGTFAYLPVLASGVEETAVFRIPGRKNSAPAAKDSALETYKNIPNQGKLSVSDPEEELLTFQIIREPDRGKVTIDSDGSFTYSPEKNKVGRDFFTYRAVDPQGNCSREAKVTVTILKPTDSPLYRDTAGEDCEFLARWMQQTGIFQGEILGDTCCFRPQKTVSRGEFLTMLLKTLKIPPEPELTAAVEELPLWLRPYGAAALRAGIPMPAWMEFEQPIPYEEAAAMAAKGQKLLTGEEAALQTWQETPAGGSPLTREEAGRLLYELSLRLAEE